MRYGTLATRLRFELTPDGITEHLYFDQILHASWNIQRCTIVEAEIQAQSDAAGLVDAVVSDDEAVIKKLDRIYRYKRMHESALARSTSELRRIQSERVHREQLVNDSTQIPAPLCTVLANTRSDTSKIYNRIVARQMEVQPEALIAYLRRAKVEQDLDHPPAAAA